MRRDFLISKLHHARITHADLEYEGSFSIDEEIMKSADIRENEKVYVYNVDNGERFSTYAIKAPYGSRIMQANGACAHKVRVKDRVIICTYGTQDISGNEEHVPTILFLDQDNNFILKEEIKDN